MTRRNRAKPAPPGSAKTGDFKLPDWMAGAVLVAALLLAYGPALHGGLLWDDAGHLTRPELQSWHGLWRIWFDPGATQQYYPLLHTAFWLEHRLWGDALTGYHLINILLHALSAFLVVRIVRRLSLPGAWLAGFLFALHPVCVEAVAWIAEQKSTLSTAFYLAAALVYLSFDRSRLPRHYLTAFLLFLLAVLSKTVIATLPAALLLLLWWERGRLGWKRDVAPLIPWFAIGLPMGLATAWVERRFIGAEGSPFALTLAQRCLLAGRAVWFYLGKLAWPANLAFTYPRWNLNAHAWWQYLYPLLLGIALAVCYRLSARNRTPLAALLFYVGTLFPALGFISIYPFLYSYVADHFQYLASLGILVAAACWAANRVPGTLGRSQAWSAVPVLPVAILGLLTWQQSHIYANSETLYRETLLRNPADWMAYNNLGIELARDPGRITEAADSLESALRINPALSDTHRNLANVLGQIPGREMDAVREYATALQTRPADPELHTRLAGLLARLPGHVPEAIAEYEAAVRLQPDSAEAHNNLGSALSTLPAETARAMAEYRTALRLKPELAEAHYNLGVALAATPGRLAEALEQFQAALQIQPDLASARLALEQLQRLKTARP